LTLITRFQNSLFNGFELKAQVLKKQKTYPKPPNLSQKNMFFGKFQKFILLIPKYLGIGTEGSNVVKIFNKLQLEVLWFIKLKKLGMEGFSQN
jgi:hypothetical protein